MKAGDRPTLADVGKLAGVSSCTASMALRKDPRISKATQNRVFEAAETLDYRPDPMLAALVARRSKLKATHVFANIAVLIDDRWSPVAQNGWMRVILEGLRSGSKRLGYQIDTFHCAQDLLSARDPNRILRSRGIRGVIVLPTVDDHYDLPLDWDSYAVVSIGTTHPLSMKTHRVGTDIYDSMHLACRKMAELGYRRLGLVNPLQNEIRTRFELLGALSKERYVPGSKVHPIRPYLPDQMQKKGFLHWFHTEKPDGIITDHWSVIEWLREDGCDIPNHVGVAILSRDTCPQENISGISQHLEQSGESAIDLLHAQLLRGETGFPAFPRELLTRSQWTDGTTTRSK